MQTAKIIVSGRVQGVWFRAYTKKTADELGITGTVKNCPVGCVEIFAQGEEIVLQKFIQWCHKGPFLAKVSNVKVSSYPENADHFSGFVIIDK